MATATVTQTPTSSKVFYAHFFDEAGVLAKVNGAITFFNPDTGTIVEVEPMMCNFLTFLGEVGLDDCQHIMDKLHGGYVKIACSRLAGVA